MKLVSALAGLAALGGVALATAAASAMPVANPGQASQSSHIVQTAYVCNAWGHCWHQPSYGEGYTHPHYYGGWGWHRWHRYGGWRGYGWHHRHHWHHWHHWHPW